MRPELTAEMAHVIVEDRIEAAKRHRRAKDARGAHTDEHEAFDSVTVRLAADNDRRALRRLAERDGRAVPRAPLLVAEVGGALLAARSIEDGTSVADPFRHTTHLAELLALRATHIKNAEDGEWADRRPVRSGAAWLKGHVLHS
jgi:hypothetical protein